MSDAAARDAITTELDTTLLVEAAAGTGKTTMLVRRCVALLRRGADVSRIAALTFSDKAAGELKVRLRGAIDGARQASEGADREALARAGQRLEEAHVSTLHTFAGELLRARPVEAGIDPRFSPASEEEASALLEEAFGQWLEGALGRRSPPLLRALTRRTISVERLRWAARDLCDHRDLDEPWRRRPWDRAADLGALMIQVRALAELSGRASNPSEEISRGLAPLRDLAERAPRLSLDELEGELLQLGQRGPVKDLKRFRRGTYAPGVDRAELRELHGALMTAVAELTQRADADLATELRAELWQVVEAYQRKKAERGVLDFDDLLLRTRALLATDEATRLALASRFEHVLVDEFQDTDPTQAAILLLLTSDRPSPSDPLSSPPAPGRLFLVGDPKQSIYRFRRADIGTYERVKDLIVESGGAVLTLSRSFRAAPALQAFVNAAFAPRMTGDRETLSASYVPLEPHREAIEGQPAVVALPVPRPYGFQKIARGAIRESYPAALGAFVAWLLGESGYRVESEAGSRPIEPGDLCVLFRQMGGWSEAGVRDVTRALADRGVPFAVTGGGGSAEDEEVRGVLNALAAIERPDDTLSVYAALRGFLFGFTDEQLLEHKERYGGLDPSRRPKTALPASLVELGDALTLLDRLHHHRNARPPAETVRELLAATRGHLTVALSPHGEQVACRLASLAQRATRQDRRGGLSFRAFVDDVSAPDALRGSADWDEQANVVRVMTVHKAKGLEFPVVLFGDPMSPATRAPGKVVLVQERLAALTLAGLEPWELLEHRPLEEARLVAEGVRLAYVAATRARDLLVVPVVGDAPAFPDEGWLSVLSGSLGIESPRKPARADLPWVKGTDSVVARPSGDGPSLSTLAPGEHVTAWGRATCFDPHALDVSVQARGVVGEALLGEGAPEDVARADLARLERAAADHAAWVDAASRSTARVETATARAHAGSGRPDGVAVERLARAPGRPAGRRFGTLVHQILASTALDAEPGAVRELSSALGRLAGVPLEEVDAAADVAIGALAHPIFDRARAAPHRVRREVPIVLPVGAGELVDGVVDLALELDEGWLVVDYKTDDPDAASPEHVDAYARQVDLYRAAIVAATGRPTRAMLLFV